MKKFLLLGFFLMSCSDIDNVETDATIPVEVGEVNPQAGGMGGGTEGSNKCKGDVEIREVNVDGKIHYLEIPILCTDKWQSPEDPPPSAVDILFRVEQERF